MNARKSELHPRLLATEYFINNYSQECVVSVKNIYALLLLFIRIIAIVAVLFALAFTCFHLMKNRNTLFQTTMAIVMRSTILMICYSIILIIHLNYQLFRNSINKKRQMH